MNEKKRDKNITKDPIGDPAFYDDQINKNKEPFKATVEKKKDGKCKNGL